MKPTRKRGATARKPAQAARATPAPRAGTERADEDSALNWRIISLLQEDGRMPFSVIAERVGVSEGTVRNRVKQLRDDNVMQITAQVLPEAFGYNWNSVVFIKLRSSESIDAAAHRLAAIPEVYYVVHMTGPHDLAITSYHRDREHFREFLAEYFYGNEEIQSIEANVNLRVYKMKLKWRSTAL